MSFKSVKLDNPPGMTSEDLKEHVDYMKSEARSLEIRGERTKPIIHDYTIQGWGHTLGGFKFEPTDVPEQYKADGFGLDVQKGDFVLLKMKDGKNTKREVIEIRYEDNPPDMFWVTIQFIEYID